MSGDRSKIPAAPFLSEPDCEEAFEMHVLRAGKAVTEDAQED